MLDRPDVSICVTTYNHAPFIERCLLSVLDQSFTGTLELLVGDDGSSDGTRELVSEMAARDSRVRPFFHPSNLGPAGNLLTLVSSSRGRCIAHLDGDDAWEPEKLQKQLAVLDADPETVAVYSNAKLVGADDTPLGLFNSNVPARIGLSELLRRGNFLNHSSLLYRASEREAVLGIPRPFIDYRIHVRLCARGVLAYVDDPLVVHRWRSPGSMIRTMPRAVVDGHIDTFEEALRVGADPRNVREAAGHAWGKVLLSGLAGRDLTELRHFSRRLDQLSGLRADYPWRLRQTVLAPLRAWRSRAARRAGVYFP